MADALLGIRESVRVAQRKQADRMETRSKKFMPEVEIGDFVILPVPDVDRGPSDPPNLACRIVDSLPGWGIKGHVYQECFR